MKREDLFNTQDNILTAFDRHFRSLGYVSPDKMESYGNRPMNDIDDESLMTTSELQESSKIFCQNLKKHIQEK